MKNSTSDKMNKSVMLSKMSTAVSVVAAVLVMCLLLYLCFTENHKLDYSRSEDGIISIEKYNLQQIKDESAPAGVVNEYTFTLDEELKNDTHLAFYSVHQYVDIYIDGEQVYSLRPREDSFIHTVGSNWTMIPLYREDAGKKIRIDITPVYERFTDRKIELLLGSRLKIFVDRLLRDLPQMIISLIAALIGIVFITIALHRRLRGIEDDGMMLLGIFAAMLGIWRFTDTRFTPLITAEKPVLTLYISLSMLIVGMLPLIKAFSTLYDSFGKKILNIYCIAAAVAAVVQVILQISGSADFRETLFITHIFIAVGVAILIFFSVLEWIKKPAKRESLASPLSILILAIGVVTDIVLFYIKESSSNLIFSLAAILICITAAGTKMLIRRAERERQNAEKDKMLAEKERQLVESRISTMISQIRPHFIYNTLGSIEQLCEIQPEEAAKLVHNFAHYLRGNFSELDNPEPIRLSQELEHVRNYVSIEQVRFPDVKIEIEMKSSDFLIPALSVQPLVENAIKHGLMKLPEGGIVSVISYETEDCCCVSVEDNGVGFDATVLMDEKKHIGLRNIRERLEKMCGGTLTVKSSPRHGTRVLISIPKGAK